MELISNITEAASFARKPVVTDLLVTFGGRILQLLLALAGSIASARALGPVDLGKFGLVMASITVFGTLADAGLTYTTIKLIAQYSARKSDDAFAVGRAYLALRLCTGATMAFVGVLVSEPVARFALGLAELTPYLQVASLTLLSMAVGSYPGTVLNGLALFGRLGLAGVLNAAITAMGIILLFMVGRLNLTTLIAWNVMLPIASTLPAWLLLPSEWLPMRRGGRDRPFFPPVGLALEMAMFSKWMALSLLGAIIAVQGDLLLLGRLAVDPAVVGIYSVALMLALRMDSLNQSLIIVMLPRASRLERSQDIRRYTRRVLGGSLALAFVLGLVALIAQPLIPLFYGQSYAESAGFFLALTPVVLFDLITGSLFLVALPLNRPRVLAAADWLRVGILGITGWLLIPAYAGYGAAAARFFSRLVGAVYTFYALRRAVTSASIDEEEPGPLPAGDWT